MRVGQRVTFQRMRTLTTALSKGRGRSAALGQAAFVISDVGGVRWRRRRSAIGKSSSDCRP